MGCGASAQKPPTVDVDAGNWNNAYDNQHKSGIISSRKIEKSSKFAEASVKYNKDNRLSMINDFAISKALGKGAFGEVYLGSQQGTGETFAIKVLKKSALKKTKMIGSKKSALDDVKAEIATLKKIAHPNCVQLLDVIHDQIADQVFLVLEFVDGKRSQARSHFRLSIAEPQASLAHGSGLSMALVLSRKWQRLMAIRPSTLSHIRRRLLAKIKSRRHAHPSARANDLVSPSPLSDGIGVPAYARDRPQRH